MNFRDRKRSLDITQLTKEEATSLGDQLGTKVTAMVDETVLKVNELLEIYGLEAKMQILIQEKGSKPKVAPKRRARTKKTSNL